MNGPVTSPTNPWRPVGAILLWVVGTVIGGALLSPWLYWVAGPWFPDAPFRRVFNRALLIVACMGLWPLLREQGVRSWSDIGWSKRTGWWRELGLGIGCGLLSLGVVIVVSVLLDHRQLDWGRRELLPLFGKLLVTAGVVAVLEETFFRGALLRALDRVLPAAGALAVTSAIYSAVHFLKPKGVRMTPAEVNWLSGFDCLGQILTKSLATPGVVMGFITLFLAGWILGWARRHTGALYFSIGLHAGWIVPNELTRKLGGGRLIEDWLAWPTLIILWVVALRLLARRDRA